MDAGAHFGHSHPRHPSLLHIQKNNVKERRKKFELKLLANEEERRRSRRTPLPPSNSNLENNNNDSVFLDTNKNDKTSFSCHEINELSPSRLINELQDSMNNNIVSPSKYFTNSTFYKNLENSEQTQLKKNKFLVQKNKISCCNSNDDDSTQSKINTPSSIVNESTIFSNNIYESLPKKEYVYCPPPLPPKPPRLLSYLKSESTLSLSLHDDSISLNFYERLQDAVSQISVNNQPTYSNQSPKPVLPPRINTKYKEFILRNPDWKTSLHRAPSVPIFSLQTSCDEDQPPYSCTQSLLNANLGTSMRNDYSRYGSSISLLIGDNLTSNQSIDQTGYAIPMQNDVTYRDVLQRVDDAYSILRRSTEFLNERDDLEQSSANINNDVFSNDLQYYSDHDKKLKHLTIVKERTYVNVSKYEEIKLRLNVSLFEFALIVGLEKNKDDIYQPIVILSHPKKLSEKDLLACTFCFPDCDMLKPVSTFTKEAFSFVLTDSNGDRKYGYCQRYLPQGEEPRMIEAICIVSPIGETGLYEQLLDLICNTRKTSLQRVQELLEAAYVKKFPRPNNDVTLCISNEDEVAVHTLKRQTELYSTNIKFGVLIHCLPINLIIQIFSSILLERKILFLAERLSTLSSCINSMLMLLYPFFWQHTLVMTLPPSLYEIIESPTPYIVGVLSKSQVLILNEYELDEVLVVDLNNRCFLRKINDEGRILPRKLQKALTASLIDTKTEKPGYPRITDVVVKEAFLRLFIETCSHYLMCIKKEKTGENIFDRQQFLEMVSSDSIRMFLDWFTHTQMFQVFISERLSESHSSRSFERRIYKYQMEMKAMATSNSSSYLGKKFIQKFKNYGTKKKKVPTATLR